MQTDPQDDLDALLEERDLLAERWAHLQQAVERRIQKLQPEERAARLGPLRYREALEVELDVLDRVFRFMLRPDDTLNLNPIQERARGEG